MSTHSETTERLSVDHVELMDCPSDAPGGKSRRRFRAIAYTGKPVDRMYGKFVIDLNAFEKRDKLPMLVDHDGAKIAGYADKMRVTPQGLELEGVLSQKTECGLMVADLADEGFPWQMSVGIDVMQREEIGEGVDCEVNGLKLTGPLSVARKCQIKETSFLYAGADDDTYAVALAAANSSGKEAPVADDKRKSLKEILSLFPNDKALAADLYADGKDENEIKLAMLERDAEALAEAKQTIENLKAEHQATVEALTAERDAALAKLEKLKALGAQAGNPGVGFNAQESEKLTSKTTPTTYAEAWEGSPALREEFGFNYERFLRYCDYEQPDIKELV